MYNNSKKIFWKVNHDLLFFSADDGSMGQQLQMLRDSIQDVLSRCSQITSNIITANTTAQGSLDDIMKAETAIERAEMALKAAENYIDVEGQAALQRAKNALDKFGQQSSQMTDIATEAKEMSMRQLEEAKRIEMLSKKALETSNEALQLAMDTLQVHYMSRLVRKPTMWFPNRSDTNRPVQLQKQARSLKFWS